MARTKRIILLSVFFAGILFSILFFSIIISSIILLSVSVLSVLLLSHYRPDILKRNKWFWGGLRISCYVVAITVLVVAGYTRDNTEVSYWAIDPVQCANGSHKSGGGSISLPAPQDYVSWEWQSPPQPWVPDYLKYDLNVPELNCSSFYLRVKVGREEGFINPTNVTARWENITDQGSIPLHYNVSRGEYVAILDLSQGQVFYPLPFRIKISINCSTVRDFTIIDQPYHYHPYYGSMETFVVTGVVAVVVLEFFINFGGKYRSMQKERLKDQALLRLLRQQNQGTYDAALQQLQTDHNQLIRQIKSVENQEGGRTDA